MPAPYFDTLSDLAVSFAPHGANEDLFAAVLFFQRPRYEWAARFSLVTFFGFN